MNTTRCILRQMTASASMRSRLPSVATTAIRSIQSRASLRTSPVAFTLVSFKRYNSSTAANATPLETPDYLSEGELKIFNIIKEELQPVKLEVQDISGGCGSMYGIDIVSEQFRGLPVIKQHRLVNKILGEEIKKWHGVQLKTKAP